MDLLAQHVVRLNAHLLEALYVPVDKRVLRRLLALRDALRRRRRRGPAVHPGGRGLDGRDDAAHRQPGARSGSATTASIELGRGRITVVDRAALELLAR